MSENLKLTPHQAATMTAYERVATMLQLEAAQLKLVWGQQGTSNELTELRTRVDFLAKRFADDCRRAIVIAHEMPPAPPQLVKP